MYHQMSGGCSRKENEFPEDLDPGPCHRGSGSSTAGGKTSTKPGLPSDMAVPGEAGAPRPWNHGAGLCPCLKGSSRHSCSGWGSGPMASERPSPCLLPSPGCGIANPCTLTPWCPPERAESLPPPSGSRPLLLLVLCAHSPDPFGLTGQPKTPTQPHLATCESHPPALRSVPLAFSWPHPGLRRAQAHRLQGMVLAG